MNDSQKAQARKNIGAGTITEIKVNGTSKGTSGSVNLTNMVTFASSQTAMVAGISKTTYTYNQPTGDNNTGSSSGSAYFPEGIIMGGTAASAGLVTRGICGVITPNATTGACAKENLYINYDGDDIYRNSRQVVLQAGSVGTHYGYNLYQYAAARGDAVKDYCDNTYAKKSDKAADSDKLDGQHRSYYLNYDNFTNTPTLGTAASKNIGTSPDNVPILDSNGKLADSVIPAVAITDTYVVANKSAMLALSAQKGDIAVRSDLNKSFVLQATPASTPEN